MSKNLIISFIVVLAMMTVLFLINKSTVTKPGNDATYVEDVGSNDTNTNTSNGKNNTNTIPPSYLGTTVTAKIGQTITLSGVTGTIKEIVQDNRCPTDVQCIQAGTVKIKVNFVYGLLNQDMTLTLGEEITMYGRSIKLSSVKPSKTSTTVIAPADYVFNLLVK